MSCPKGKEYDGGLCYKPCKDGFKGVGPVCWAKCPSGFKDIGVTCQKPTRNRGIGVPVSECPSDHPNKDAGLCYKDCPSNYKGVGPVCWGECPSGFKDTGIDCLKPKSYGRGAGHISKEKCEKSDDHGAKKNGCEKYGLLWYPKCDHNYHHVGCCVCSPNCPSDFKDIGISCQKPTHDRGVGVPISECASDHPDKDAGLCYKKCPPGFKGIATVCWGKCPPDNFTDAGVDCTKKSYGRGAGTIPKLDWWWYLVIAFIAIIVIVVLIFAGKVVLNLSANPPPVVPV